MFVNIFKFRDEFGFGILELCLPVEPSRKADFDMISRQDLFEVVRQKSSITRLGARLQGVPHTICKFEKPKFN